MIVSKKLRASAGHHNAYCTNRQKTLHCAMPESLPLGRVAKQCSCGTWFSLPTCHAQRHKSCTALCAATRRRDEAKARERVCKECEKPFLPRPNQVAKGQGKFCSIACSLTATRRTDAFKEAVRSAPRSGPKSGPENPQWRGGPQASQKRRQESGKASAQLRRYRSENPHKAREWQQNRRNRKAGRLEYGTIPRLMEAQRRRCAHCGKSLRSGYHVDHIKPLSKGGKHEAANIQLLCGPCNLHKSNRDPIAFAQMSGRLL